jgi:hypothetical protein
MGAAVDPLRKRFVTQLDKTLRQALAQRIGQEFPRLGGERIRLLCADMLLEVFAAHVRPAQHLQHGQLLWLAVAVDDPPARHKPLTATRLLPVVLDLSTAEDVQALLRREPAGERLLARCRRLCRQAYAQGGLLSNCDLAMMLHVRDGAIANLLSQYEDKTKTVVPRRATVHDVGTGLTHKRLICRKRYLEGKDAAQVGRETYHSLEAVDRYLGQYDRVRHCRKQGLDEAQTAFTLHCGRGLVRQYLAIDEELEKEAAGKTGKNDR